MAVPEGIPLMLVFTGIFVFLVLFVSCIVLSVIVKDTLIRAGLIAAALMLAAVMGGGAYLTMTGNEEEEKPPEEAAIELPDQPTPETPPPEEAKPGDVVLVIDQSTITEDFDPLKTDRLSVENPSKGKSKDANAQQERTKIGREITAIETDLNNQLLALESQIQEVLRRFDAQEIENYDMIFWQAKLKKQQYGFIVHAMDQKQKILEKATSLSSEEKAADLARIDLRRQKALEKWKEYRGVLAELTANQDAFRTL